jgi:hypothetical protein
VIEIICNCSSWRKSKTYKARLHWQILLLERHRKSSQRRSPVKGNRRCVAPPIGNRSAGRRDGSNRPTRRIRRWPTPFSDCLGKRSEDQMTIILLSRVRPSSPIAGRGAMPVFF